MNQPADSRGFHLPSFLLGVVAALGFVGVVLAAKGCPPEPVPVAQPAEPAQRPIKSAPAGPASPARSVP